MEHRPPFCEETFSCKRQFRLQLDRYRYLLLKFMVLIIFQAEA